jgi:dihydrofolate synthase/folylpolyglutamate synthase
MRALAAALADALPGRPRIAVTSVLGDKDVGAMMSALAGRADLVIATRSTHRRAATPDAIVAACADAGVEARAVADPRRAVDAAAAAAGPSGGVVVCGSLYLLGDVRAHVRAAADPTPDTLARARDGASLTDEAEGP